MKKRGFSSLLIALILIMQTCWPMMVYAAEGQVVVAVSASEVKIGDTVTITASSLGPNQAKAVSTMEISYNSDMFSFVSCGIDDYNGGEGGIVKATASSYSIKLKAIASGSASIKVSGSNGKNSDTQEALSAMVAAGTTIAVSGGGTDSSDNSTKSPDNSLAQLNLSQGTLSPELAYSTTNYTASVPEDVTSIDIDAKPANAKAEIESITGNTDLQMGENTINIVVKAENGAKALYKLVVTRGGAAKTGDDAQTTEAAAPETTEEGIVINGVSYKVSGEFPDEAIPDDFTKETITYQEQEVAGAKFNNGELRLLYLTSESDENKGFYAYENNSFQPFLRLASGENYIIALPGQAAETIPAGYEETSVTIGDTEGVSGYTYTGENKPEGADDFCLLYGMDKAGTAGWYRYDSVERTVQRYIDTYAYSGSGAEGDDSAEIAYTQEEYKELNEKYTKEKASSRKMTIIYVFIIILLIITIINILLFKNGKGLNRKKERDVWDDDEIEEEDIIAPENKIIETHDDKDTPEEKKEKEKVHADMETDLTENTEKKEDLEIIDLDDL